jgi:flagellar basal-body rod protein FlgG
MTTVFDVASTGLGAQQRAMEVIAHNVSNINTPGFKRSSVSYADVVASMAGQGGSAGGVSASPSLVLNSQGELQQTGNRLDMAIDGPGFVELLGRDGQMIYWRGGTLEINRDGYLAGPDGMALRALIQIPSDARDLVIDSDGAVTALLGGGQERTELGRIGLVAIDTSDQVERMDGGLYKFTGVMLPEGRTPGEDGAGRLVQGAVELSTVDLNEEMVRMLIVQRAYAANAQVIQAADQFMSISNNLRRS